MKLFPFILLLSLGVTACSRSSDSAKAPDSTQASDTTNSPDTSITSDSGDQVTTVEKDDPDMLAAFAKARSETDNFIVIMNAGTGDPKSYSVKVAVTDNGQTEYFWIDNLTYANGLFSGTIDNDPDVVKNVKIGQQINVKKEEIYDWLYMKDGKMYGNYTVRVLLPKMSKEDADKIRAMLPPE